jgi:Rv0078B-related antitoxin
VALTDTTPAAQALQLKIQRSLGGEQRLLLALEMSLFARELGRANIRQQHPDWPEGRVVRELLRLAFLPAPLPLPPQ